MSAVRTSFSIKRNNCQGFTLIELSIVLVILGLIIGTIAPLFKSLTKNNKITEGREVVTTASAEIKGEVIRTRSLPSDLSNIGHSVDPWDNTLTYIPAPNLAGNNLCNWLATGSNQTGLAVCLGGDCGGGKKANVAYVIASSGSNFNRQLEAAANRDAIAADREVRLYAYGTTTDGYTVAPDPNRATDQYDDIIEYVTVAELLQLANCSVTLRNQTGTEVCSGGAAIASNVDIVTLEYNQSLTLGGTADSCMTISSSCTISYLAAENADTDKNGQVGISSAPPACTLTNL